MPEETSERVLFAHPDDVNLADVKALAAGRGVNVIASRYLPRGSVYLGFLDDLRPPESMTCEQGNLCAGGYGPGCCHWRDDPSTSPGDPGPFQERCSHIGEHGPECAQDEIGDWWHPSTPPGSADSA